MAIQMQEKPAQEPFIALASEFLDDPFCPLCGTGMRELNDQGEVFCPNDSCPHVTNDGVYDVINALVDQGHDRLRAAQIAALYTLELDDDPGDTLSTDRFAITDETSANWVLKKIAHLERRLSGANAMCDSEIESIERRRRAIFGGLI